MEQFSPKGYDELCKVIIIGDAGVGKTSLLYRFVEDKFTTIHGLNDDRKFLSKCLLVDSKKVKFAIWDKGDFVS